MRRAGTVYTFIPENFWAKVSLKVCLEFPLFQQILLVFVKYSFHFHKKQILQQRYLKFFICSNHFRNYNKKLAIVCGAKLHTGWTFEIRGSVRARYFSLLLNVQTGYGAHPVSCSIGIGVVFPG